MESNNQQENVTVQEKEEQLQEEQQQFKQGGEEQVEGVQEGDQQEQQEEPVLLKGSDIKDNWEFKVDNFDELNLDADLLRGIYGYGYEQPSQIQQKAILPIIQKKDTLAQAQSGTGKTGAFSIGILQNVDPKVDRTQALILSPTRELSKQIQRVVQSLGEFQGVVVHCSTGGTNIRQEKQALKARPHIVVGTPGRVLDMMSKKFLKADGLQMFCLDEADEMLGRGFQEQIDEIFKLLPGDIQIILFSATMPYHVLELSQQFLRDPARILVQKEKLTLDGIKQYFLPVNKAEWKFETLIELFSNLEIAQCVIFCNKKEQVEQLAEDMTSKGFTVSFMHGGQDQRERDKIMYEFRTASTRVLIATDLIARGIDVQQVQLVINYDLPTKMQTYLHRIGRSGRFGRKGTAINFVTTQDAKYMAAIEKHFSTEIKELPNDVTDLLA